MMRKIMAFIVLAAFLTNCFVPPQAYAQALPAVVAQADAVVKFQPTILRAVGVNMDNPLKFDFYVDHGQEGLATQDKQQMFRRLIKDFLTALTIPDADLWVNLSPYEQGRMIEERFGLTEMGRDLLAQDYVLKQRMAGMLYPEDTPGKSFWAEVYRKAYEQYGTTDIDIDTFNKVWIMPDEAKVYQEGGMAVVMQGHLKVMLESDYVAMENNVVNTNTSEVAEPPAKWPKAGHDEMAKDIIRKIVLPMLERSVNEGKEFARVRQIYHALILAAWYKKALRESFLGKTYADRSLVKGVDQKDLKDNQRIYQRYVETFRQGAYNYIKNDMDRYSGEVIPRKYFSGGFTLGNDFAQKVTVVGEKKIGAIEAKGLIQKRGTNHIIAELVPHNKDNPDDDFKGIKDLEEVLTSIESLAKQLEKEETNYYAMVSSSTKKRIVQMKETLAKQYLEALRLVLAGHDPDGAIEREIVAPLISGNWSSLQEMILRGRYIIKTLRQFAILAQLLHMDSDEIDYDDALQQLGLRAPMRPYVNDILSSLRASAEFGAFYQRFFSLFYGIKVPKTLENRKLKDKNTVFVRKWKDDFEQYQKLQRKESFWRDTLNALSHQDRNKRLKEASRVANVLLPNVYTYVKSLNPGPNALFVRVKASMSMEKKAESKEQSLGDIVDFIGVRIVVDGDLSDLENEVLSFEKNARQDKGVIRIANKYLANAYKRKYYCAFHYLLKVPPSMAPNGWTVEVQVKTLLQTIASDIEHGAVYKPKGEAGEVIKAVKVYYWLVTIVESLNYLYDKKPMETAAFLENYRLSAGLLERDAAQKNANSVDTMTRGGIDVRNIEGQLQVQGRDISSVALLDYKGRLGKDVDGYVPIILSVRSLEALPLHQKGLSGL